MTVDAIGQSYPLMLRRSFAVLAAVLVAALALPADAIQRPVLVFFPFNAGASVPATLSTQIPAKIEAELKALGGIAIIDGDPTAKPESFRSLARAAGADGYVSGSIVAIGNSFAVLEQLVSARSGVMLWSNSTGFRSIDEVRGAGQSLHDLLVTVQPPLTAGTLPVEAVAPAAAPSGAGILPLPSDGNSSRDDRSLADQTVAAAIKHLGFTVLANPKGQHNLAGLCSDSHAKLLLSTRVDMSRAVPKTGGDAVTTAIVSMVVYDCTTKTFDPNPVAVTHAGATNSVAIKAAITEALVLLPSLPPVPNS